MKTININGYEYQIKERSDWTDDFNKNFQIGALKAIDEEMENRGMDRAPRTSVPDAAPRVLTGDCKIRVRK